MSFLVIQKHLRHAFALSLSMAIFIANKATAVSAFTTYGNITQLALPVAALGIIAAKQDTTGLKDFTYTYTSTLAVTYALKYTVNRRRPNGGYHSFPSGHTASAFAASSYIWMRYGKNYGIPATALASAVGVSRVVGHYHYWTDVMTSALLGTVSSYLFTKNISLELSSHSEAITYTYHFKE